MAKTATKKTVRPEPAQELPPAPAPVAGHQIRTIDIAPSEGATEAISLKAQAAALVVTNQDQHRVTLEFTKAAKQLRRKIVDHWTPIKRNIDQLKANILDLERKDLAPVDEAIAISSRVALDFEAAEQRRVDEQNAINRRIAEQQAEADRQAELQRQEQAALDAEASSPNLSARENIFVEAYLASPDSTRAAKLARYAGDPVAVGVRVLGTKKVQDAIAARRSAAAIREQAAATAEQPLDVKVETVQKQTARVAGVSSATTWRAEIYDVDKFLDAAGVPKNSVLRDALQLNQVYLNAEAKRLQGKLESVYPGVRGKSSTGLRG